MSNNLLLYGSTARGDNAKNSDVDLLSVVGTPTEKKVVNNLSISLYHHDQILDMARNGALFVYHLREEGKILIDDEGLLNEILHAEFKKRDSYSSDSLFAVHMLRSILAVYHLASNYTFINAKVGWCLRTVYAAHGADNDIPVFSVSSAVNLFGQKAKLYLSIRKRNDHQKLLANTVLRHVESLTKAGTFSDEEFESGLISYKDKVISKIVDDSRHYTGLDYD